MSSGREFILEAAVKIDGTRKRKFSRKSMRTLIKIRNCGFDGTFIGGSDHHEASQARSNNFLTPKSARQLNWYLPALDWLLICINISSRHLEWHSIGSEAAWKNQFCRLETFFFRSNVHRVYPQGDFLSVGPLQVTNDKQWKVFFSLKTCLAWKFIKITQVELNSNWRQIIGGRLFSTVSFTFNFPRPRRNGKKNFFD